MDSNDDKLLSLKIKKFDVGWNIYRTSSFLYLLFVSTRSFIRDKWYSVNL